MRRIKKSERGECLVEKWLACLEGRVRNGEGKGRVCVSVFCRCVFCSVYKKTYRPVVEGH